MLIPQILSFLLPRDEARLKDPEKGPDVAQNSEEDEPRPNPSIEDDTSDNEIVQHLEEEEYAVEQEVTGDEDKRRNFNPLKFFKAPKWLGSFKQVLFPKTTKKDLEAYVPNYRYTPIVSGVVIPFSILLEIPGFQQWYIRTEDHKVVEIKKNTLILDLGLGISLACGVLANMALIMRFLEKRVKAMTLACVFFLTLHDVINIIAVIVFGVEHRFDDGFTYGQSFWFTICSTIASTATNMTLIFDLIRTPSFENSGSGLTRKQRALVIIVMVLLCYIAIGSFVNSALNHLTFINALYFTIVSIETVGKLLFVPHCLFLTSFPGFGDITPASTGAKVFISFYSIFGIVTLAIAVGLARDTVLEGLEVGYRKRVTSMRETRRMSRWRRRVTGRWREAVEWRLRDAGAPLWVKDNPTRNPLLNVLVRILNAVFPWEWSIRGWFGKKKEDKEFLGRVTHPRGMHLNLEALPHDKLAAAAMEAGVPLSNLLPPGFKPRRPAQLEVQPGSSREGSHDLPPLRGDDPGPDDPDELPLTHARMGKMIAILARFALLTFDGARQEDEPSSPQTPSVRRNQLARLDTFQRQDSKDNEKPKYKKSLADQYDAFHSLMEREEKKALNARLVVVWLLFLTFWLTGTAIFMRTEGWSFGIALYFCVIAFTTIGYGDYAPKTPAGRSIFVVWALLGVATMTILISVLSEAYSSRYKSAIHSSVFDGAVKQYRQSVKSVSHKLASQKRTRTTQPRISDRYRNLPKHEAIEHSHRAASEKVEQLPHHILKAAEMFHENIQYFLGATHAQVNNEVPNGIKELLDDITEGVNISEKIKQEILEDEDARHTLFTLSIEQALSRMIESAEDALNILEERDSVFRHHTREEEEAIDNSQEDRVRAVDFLWQETKR